jgi:hypothetical protein
VGLYVVIGGGALSVVGGLTAVFGRRKTKPVEEAAELPEPDRLAKEWLAAREQEAAARSAPAPEPPKPELVPQAVGPPPTPEPPKPELVTQPAGPPPTPQTPQTAKRDDRAAWTKPLPTEWAAKAPTKGRRRRRP